MLAWEGCYNVRDVGGLVGDGGVPLRSGALVRADSLGRLTPDGWQAAIGFGVRTVVDLRSDEESAWFPQLDLDPPPPVTRVRVPLLDADAWRALSESRWLAAGYAIMLERCAAGFAHAVEAIGAAAPGAVVVHCQVGKDRTGLVTALLLDLLGVASGAIAADYARSEPLLEPLFRRWIDETEDPELKRRIEDDLRAPETAMLETLELLAERYGGSARYLLAGGASADGLARVRQRLLVEGATVVG